MKRQLGFLFGASMNGRVSEFQPSTPTTTNLTTSGRTSHAAPDFSLHLYPWATNISVESMR